MSSLIMPICILYNIHPKIMFFMTKELPGSGSSFQHEIMFPALPFPYSVRSASASRSSKPSGVSGSSSLNSTFSIVPL